MGRGYMPQNTFNYGAAAMAAMVIREVATLDDMLDKLVPEYQGMFGDEQELRADWSVAVRELLELAKTVTPGEKHAVFALYHLEWYMQNYLPDGSLRPRRLFNGSFFNRLSKPIPNRIDVCKQMAFKYLAMLHAGIAPLRPR